MYTYALIASGNVLNIFMWDGVTPLDLPDYDTAVRVDTVSPQPGLGWTTPDFGQTWVAPAPPPVSPQVAAAQAYAAFIASGLEVTSESTASLSGNYPIQDTDQASIATEAQFISTFGEFTNQQTVNLLWQQSNGTNVVFPTMASFLAFAKAAGQLVAAAKVCGISGNPMPSNQVSIP